MDKILAQEKIKSISLKILNFEEGDLLFTSDIIDGISEIETIFIEKKSLEIISFLKKLLKDSLSTSLNISIQDVLSQGIDLLLRFLEIEENQSENPLLTEDFNSFLKQFEQKTIEPSLEIKNITSPSEKTPLISLNSEPLKIFLSEAEEKLTLAQDAILNLEKDLNNKTIINELFRIFHTIKGECGFLKLASLSELTHCLESLLDMIRNDEIANNTEMIEILLAGIDHSNAMIDALRQGNITIYNEIENKTIFKQINHIIHCNRLTMGEILKNDGKLSEGEVVNILNKQKESSFTKKFGEIAQEEALLSENEVMEALDKQKKQAQAQQKKLEKVDPIIKVKASQINFLVDMIGELLIAENQLNEKDKNVIQLKKITREIQMAAMQLRTIKIKSLFMNMRRLLRDISKDLNKMVEMDVIGEDLEIDRNLVEILEEPMMHIIRNSVSHGIESAEQRLENNKSPEGKILLKAERRGNHIVIFIRDNGKGLDEEKIIQKAISRGLTTAEKAKNLTKNHIFDFIFLPGFSTAEKVDSISGRGVGMDVVKSTVSGARGKIEIKSEKGQFTELSLIFPLSMAIIDGMIIREKDSFFIIPVNSIVESLKIKKDMIQTVRGKINVLDLRNEFIPVIDLGAYFKIGEKDLSDNRIAVLVEHKETKFAFLLDEIVAKKEIVIKPLGKKFKNLKGISAGTILSGGKIGFILDIDQIVDSQEFEK